MPSLSLEYGNVSDSAIIASNGYIQLYRQGADGKIVGSGVDKLEQEEYEVLLSYSVTIMQVNILYNLDWCLKIKGRFLKKFKNKDIYIIYSCTIRVLMYRILVIHFTGREREREALTLVNPGRDSGGWNKGCVQICNKIRNFKLETFLFWNPILQCVKIVYPPLH